MKKKIFLHVGTLKTGSTFLQRNVFNQLDTFRFCTYRDPIFEKLRIVQFLLPNDPRLISLKNEVIREVEADAKENILISDEQLFGMPYLNFMNNETCARNLSRIFSDYEVKVLIVIRRQDELLESLYKQLIKMGYPINVKSFLNVRDGEFFPFHFNNGLNVDFKAYNFLSLIRSFEQNFENISILPFEMIKEDSEKFLDAVIEFLELDSMNINRNKEVNVSYSNATYRIGIFLNRLFSKRNSNGYGFIPETPFRSELLKHYTKSRLLGVLLVMVSKIRVENILNSLNFIFRNRNGNKFLGKYQKEILFYHKQSNLDVSAKFQLELGNYGYF